LRSARLRSSRGGGGGESGATSTIASCGISPSGQNHPCRAPFFITIRVSFEGAGLSKARTDVTAR
jgi:hypothetical protein